MATLRFVHGHVIPRSRRTVEIAEDDAHFFHGKDSAGLPWVFGLYIDSGGELVDIPSNIGPFDEDAVKRMNTIAKQLCMVPKRFRNMVFLDDRDDDE